MRRTRPFGLHGDFYRRVVQQTRTLLFLPLHLRRDFQAQGVQPDEAGGVVLVMIPHGRDRVGFHRGN